MLRDYKNKSMGCNTVRHVSVRVVTAGGTACEWLLPAEPYEWLETTLAKTFGAGDLKTTGRDAYEWVVRRDH